jgi:hypothetical protein
MDFDMIASIMARFRRLMMSLPFALVAASFAAAQGQSQSSVDPAKAALIEELLVALKAQQNQQQMMGTVRTSMLSQMDKMVDLQLKNSGVGTRVDPALNDQIRNDVRDFEGRIFDLMASRMSWENMKPVYFAVYDQTFATDELRPLVAFFKSPAGQAYVTKTPAVLANTMNQMQQVLSGMMPELQKLNNEFTQRMKEKYSEKH